MPKRTKGRKLKIVVTGGGTGGHIMPALAVADALRTAGHRVDFIGSRSGQESALVPAEGFTFHAILAGKWRRYADWQNIVDIARMKIGFFQSILLLRSLRPDVVFAKGGYVSLPVVYAAALLGIPVVAHESDVTMGLANRLTASRAAVICTGFPVEHYPEALRAKLRFTGSPIRSIFRRPLPVAQELRRKYKLNLKKPTVLFLGGSQGSHAINRLVINGLEESLDSWQIIHLTGRADFAWACAAAESLPADKEKHYRPYAFVGDELPELMALADIVVTRSSANVVAELAAVGKPVALIPLPTSANDHQRANAKILKREKAAVVWEESELRPAVLLDRVSGLLRSPAKLEALGKALRALDRPAAVADIVSAVEEAVGQ